MVSLSRPLTLGFLLMHWMWMMMTMMMNVPITAATGAASTNYSGGAWELAHATFYGDQTASPTMGGACGYASFIDGGYGTQTTALSSTLFRNGLGCGTCYQLQCVQSPHCNTDSPFTTVTATNLCPPNWAKDSNAGGWCNPPRVHFDMALPAFMQIADWHAGIVPVMYRRVDCMRTGGIRFQFQGNAYWLLVYVMNMGGAGDIGTIWVRGKQTRWISMSHNWGASYQAFATLGGQPLAFMITTRTARQSIVAWNVAPGNWSAGMTYEANVNFH